MPTPLDFSIESITIRVGLGPVIRIWDTEEEISREFVFPLDLGRELQADAWDRITKADFMDAIWSVLSARPRYYFDHAEEQC